jgi:hypothetical protein
MGNKLQADAPDLALTGGPSWPQALDAYHVPGNGGLRVVGSSPHASALHVWQPGAPMGGTRAREVRVGYSLSAQVHYKLKAEGGAGEVTAVRLVVAHMEGISVLSGETLTPLHDLVHEPPPEVVERSIDPMPGRPFPAEPERPTDHHERGTAVLLTYEDPADSGPRVVSGGKNGLLRLWNPEAGPEGAFIRRLGQMRRSVTAVAAAGGLLAAGDRCGQVWVIDLATGACLAQVDTHPTPISHLALFPASSDPATLRMAVVNLGHPPRVYDVDATSGATTLRHELQAHGTRPSHLLAYCDSATGRDRVASSDMAEADASVTVSDAESGEVVSRLPLGRAHATVLASYETLDGPQRIVVGTMRQVTPPNMALGQRAVLESRLIIWTPEAGVSGQGGEVLRDVKTADVPMQAALVQTHDGAYSLVTLSMNGGAQAWHLHEAGPLPIALAVRAANKLG